MISGVLVIGIGTGFYIGAGMGAGPRDSLMLVLSARTGRIGADGRGGSRSPSPPVGVALGGAGGIGTLVFAFGIGPAVELSFWALERFAPRRSADGRIGRAMERRVSYAAGGEATRLGELTRVANKHLLPVGSWPMIYYPLQLLQRGEMHEVLLVTGKGARRADDRPAGRRAGGGRGAPERPLLRARSVVQGADRGRGASPRWWAWREFRRRADHSVRRDSATTSSSMTHADDISDLGRARRRRRR